MNAVACEVLSQQVDGITVEAGSNLVESFVFGEISSMALIAAMNILWGNMMRGNNLLNGIDDKDIMPFTINLDVCFIPTNRTG